MNSLHLTFFKLVIMSLIGVPLALLVDPGGRYFYLAGGISREYVGIAYGWCVYSFVLLVGLHFALGLGPAMVAYQERPSVPAERAHLQTLWLAAFSGAAVCTLVLFAQTGFSHPALSVLGLRPEEIAVLRIETSTAINGNVYNLGLHVFMAFALAVAVFYLRSPWLTLVSVGLLLFLVTFSLQKAPLADVLIELAFVFLLLRRGSWRTALTLGVLLITVLAAMAIFTGWSRNPAVFALGLSSRVFWGQFSDLPHYFARFAHDRVDFLAILPPYLQGAIGTVQPSAARVVMEYSNPDGVRAGMAGVSTTLYIGEAYAVGGIPAVLAAPFLAGGVFAVVIRAFGHLRKDAVTVFAFGYLLDRMTVALFSGFGSFLFSAIHVIFGAVLFMALVSLAVPPRSVQPGYANVG